MAQQPAGIRWLHIHPDYLVTDLSWLIVKLARNWEDGFLPEDSVPVQAAFTMAGIHIVRRTWGKMRAARDKD